MNLLEQLNADLKTAMLSQDSQTVSVLRMLKSEIKNEEIAQGQDLSEEMAWKVIRREIKKRQDASQSFQAANQAERAASEAKEAEVLQKYLPAQADPAELEKFAKEFISQFENPGPKQKGETIKAVLGQFPGRTDGSVVSGIVNRLIP